MRTTSVGKSFVAVSSSDAALLDAPGSGSNELMIKQEIFLKQLDLFHVLLNTSNHFNECQTAKQRHVFLSRKMHRKWRMLN